MTVYVAVIDGVIYPEVSTSLKWMCEAIGMKYITVRRAIKNDECKRLYKGRLISIKSCRVIKQSGKANNYKLCDGE